MGKNSKIICFDFETGGLNPENNPVMEIAAIVTNQENFMEGAIYEGLIKPYRGKEDKELIYEDGALKTHGISISEATEKGMTINQMVKDLIALFKECNKGNRGSFNKPILAGHNVSFDISFLKYAFELCGQNLYEYVMSNNGQIVRWDTMELAIQLWNTNPNGEDKYNLEACCRKAGLGDFLAHRSLPDTRQTLNLLRILIETGRGNKSNIAVSSNNNPQFNDSTAKVKQIQYPSPQRVKLKF